jgi:hypothetical protein
MYRLQHKESKQYLVHGGRWPHTTKNPAAAGLWPLRYIKMLRVNKRDWNYTKVEIVDIETGSLENLLNGVPAETPDNEKPGLIVFKAGDIIA